MKVIVRGRLKRVYHNVNANVVYVDVRGDQDDVALTFPGHAASLLTPLAGQTVDLKADIICEVQQMTINGRNGSFEVPVNKLTVQAFEVQPAPAPAPAKV